MNYHSTNREFRGGFGVSITKQSPKDKAPGTGRTLARACHKTRPIYTGTIKNGYNQMDLSIQMGLKTQVQTHICKSSNESSCAVNSFSFVMNCGGSSRLDEPRTTSLCSLPLSLWQTLSSDLVAPPTMNTKTRRPIFLKSLDACLRMESLE
uniref:SNARE-interacting protein KEULE n=1 Tax=Rhizophora mucronata TaxID=61149 RepID=A0A2P2M8R4_RHIMU